MSLYIISKARKRRKRSLCQFNEIAIVILTMMVASLILDPSRHIQKFRIYIFVNAWSFQYASPPLLPTRSIWTSSVPSPVQWIQRRISSDIYVSQSILRYPYLHRHSKYSSSNSWQLYQTSSSSSSVPTASHSFVQNNHTAAARKIPTSVIVLLAVSFLPLLGFTMTSPLLPTLGQHFRIPLGSSSFGLLTSAYPLGMFFGVFFWSFLSDIVGRKYTLLMSLFGSSVGLFLQSKVISNKGSMTFFIGMRILTGIFAGSASIVKASLADIASTTKPNASSTNSMANTANNNTDTSSKSDVPLPTLLAWRDAACTMAYIIGPVLGGSVYQHLITSSTASCSTSITSSIEYHHHALAFVIRITAMATFVAASLITFGLSDLTPKKMKLQQEKDNTTHSTVLLEMERKSQIEEEINIKNTTFINNEATTTNTTTYITNPTTTTTTTHETHTIELLHHDHLPIPVISCPVGSSIWNGIITICIVSFLFHIADSTFFSFFPAILKTQLSLNAQEIGMTFTTFATISFLLSATSITSRLIQRWNVVITCTLGLAMIAIGLLSLTMTNYCSSTTSIVAAWLHPTIKSVVYPFLSNYGSMLGTLSSGALYFCGVSLYSPCIPYMLLQCVPNDQRGRVMGLDGAINTMARILSPLIMGELYRQRGASMTFGLSSIGICCSVLMMVLQSRRVV